MPEKFGLPQAAKVYGRFFLAKIEAFPFPSADSSLNTYLAQEKEGVLVVYHSLIHHLAGQIHESISFYH